MDNVELPCMCIANMQLCSGKRNRTGNSKHSFKQKSEICHICTRKYGKKREITGSSKDLIRSKTKHSSMTLTSGSFEQRNESNYDNRLTWREKYTTYRPTSLHWVFISI